MNTPAQDARPLFHSVFFADRALKESLHSRRLAMSFPLPIAILSGSDRKIFEPPQKRIDFPACL